MALGRATPDADDLAGEITAKSPRRSSEQGDEPQVACANLRIERIERNGLHADLGLARARQRIAYVLDPQHVGGAVAFETQRAHR